MPPLTSPRIAKVYFWRGMLLRKANRRRATKLGLIGLNFAFLTAVLAIVLIYPNHSSVNSQAVATISGPQTAVTPIDPLASVNIALTVARMTNLPEAAAVANQADSESIYLSLASANNTVVDKPQSVVSAFISNKDIHTYYVQANDTLTSIATKFGVTTNSILWSNNLLSDSLSQGEKLLIPPVNGIVYTVKAGDTPASLAAKFHASESQIISDNDAEISGLQVGEQIIIPNGTIVTPIAPIYYYSPGFAWGASAIYGYNGYDWGNCTWYVATQIAVPANWGNAATWADGARAAGWHVSPTPTVGAIAQTPYADYGLGHVAIVVAVSGSEVEIREMNDAGAPGGGFGRVDTIWEPTSTYPNYITAP